MGELDIGVMRRAACSYVRLRRRYWRCFFGMALLLVSIAISLSALRGEAAARVRVSIATACGIAYCACALGAILSWSALMRFRCPRCGKRFVLAWWSSWPTDRCKHCELDLGPAVLADAKKPAVVDVLD
jgi:hypothetical protein